MYIIHELRIKVNIMAFIVAEIRQIIKTKHEGYLSGNYDFKKTSTILA